MKKDHEIGRIYEMCRDLDAAKRHITNALEQGKRAEADLDGKRLYAFATSTLVQLIDELDVVKKRLTIRSDEVCRERYGY